MPSIKFENLRYQIRGLLFEDTYNVYSDMDNLRAGQAVGESEPLEADPASLPLNVNPQIATQLSSDMPPVDDPEYAPTSKSELGRALATLASDIPDETEAVQKVYDKVKEIVDDNKGLGIEVVDLSTVGDAEEDLKKGDPAVEKEEVKEARARIRNALIIRKLVEQSGMPDTDLYGNVYDEEAYGASEVPEEEMKAEPLQDEGTLADVAKDMGISVSGAKRIEAQGLKNLRLVQRFFPEDIDGVMGMAMNFYANGLHELGLIDKEDVADLMSEPAAMELKSFRTFMWNGFLNNVHNAMIRDAKKQGIDPETSLNEITPGLLDRAKDYFAGLPNAKKMKDLVSSLSAAE